MSTIASKLNDAIFGQLRTADSLEHLVRYLGTWAGSDKLFMIIQYTIKLIVPFLRLRAKLQYSVGKEPARDVTERYNKLSSLIGDSRTLWRIWGLLPIFQWLITLEKTPPATRKLLTIERLQAWLMLFCCPLEQVAYLIYHGIIPTSFGSPLSIFSSKKRRITLNPDVISRWSCRFWATYVILQLFHLIEDRKLLRQRNISIRKAKGTALSKEEKEEMTQRWDAFWSDVMINVGYLPLTIHWSLRNGLFKNEIWVGVFGLMAAVGSFRTGWKATAQVAQPTRKSDDFVEASSSEVSGYHVSS